MYRIPKIQEKLNTLYSNFDQRIRHIPEIRRPQIPYTQNPWPGLCVIHSSRQDIINKCDSYRTTVQG